MSLLDITPNELKWIEIEQGSDYWLNEWRPLGLGGSTAAVVMGVSKFSDPIKLFEEILGKREKPDLAWAKKLGDMAEERIKPWLEKHYNLNMIPICVERTTPGEEWLRVSLDGADLDNDIIGEYKYANKKDHAGVLRGEVPKHYWPQVQYQLFVTRAPKLIYVSYWEKADDYAAVMVEPDKEYQKDLYERMKHFWECIQTETQPIAPVHEAKGDDAWLKQLEIVKEIKNRLDDDKELYQEEFKKLCSMTKSVVTVGGGARLTRVKGKETIDWNQVADIKKCKENLTPEEIKKITKTGKPSWKLTYTREK